MRNIRRVALVAVAIIAVSGLAVPAAEAKGERQWRYRCTVQTVRDYEGGTARGGWRNSRNAARASAVAAAYDGELYGHNVGDGQWMLVLPSGEFLAYVRAPSCSLYGTRRKP